MNPDSQLIDDLWFEVREFVPEAKRQMLARKFITIAQEYGVRDWGEDLLVEEEADINHEASDEEEEIE